MSNRWIACSLTAIAVASIAAPAWAADQPPAGETDQQRIERLERTVSDLTRRRDERDRQDAATAQSAPPQPQPLVGPQPEEQQHAGGQADTLPPMPRRTNHNVEVYGFAQLDAIQDFNRVNPDWNATLRPSRLPTPKGEFGSDGQPVFSARQSRLGARANGEVAGH